MIIDYTCYTKHCKYNESEQCAYHDEEFIEEYLAVGNIDNCHMFEVKDGYCECGNMLIEYKERHPYGDTYVYEYLLKCPKCD